MTTINDNVNIEFWDELAEIHSGNSDYNLDSFSPDKYELKDLDLSLLGDLTGKRVLHLQCHIGLDSFALERLGAEVTAVDYSQKAIDTAQGLSQQFNMGTQFYCENINDLDPETLGQFDLIFTSYGILVWLSDLSTWADAIARCLKPGGKFIIIDEHPVARMFSNPSEDNFSFNSGPLRPYWNAGRPFKANYKFSYACDDKELGNQTQYVWSHTVADVLNSIVSAGLDIDAFQEYDKTFFKAFAQLVPDGSGWWRFPEGTYSAPLMFSLQAHKK